jgi:hypothetical protein
MVSAIDQVPDKSGPYTLTLVLGQYQQFIDGEDNTGILIAPELNEYSIAYDLVLLLKNKHCSVIRMPGQSVKSTFNLFAGHVLAVGIILVEGQDQLRYLRFLSGLHGTEYNMVHIYIQDTIFILFPGIG